MCDAVVCILAYSIKCKESVSYIASTISSIAHQSVPLDGLYISMYNEIDCSVVKSSVEQVLDESSLKYDFDSHTRIHTLEVTYAAPPFVQYKQLLEYMKEKKFWSDDKRVWILFSSGLEIWNVDRVKKVRERAACMSPDSTAFADTQEIFYNPTHSDTILSVQDVNSGLKNKSLLLMAYPGIPELQYTHVRLSTVRKFFENKKTQFLIHTNRLCYAALIHWIQKSCSSGDITQWHHDDWLCFRRFYALQEAHLGDEKDYMASKYAEDHALLLEAIGNLHDLPALESRLEMPNDIKVYHLPLVERAAKDRLYEKDLFHERSCSQCGALSSKQHRLKFCICRHVRYCSRSCQQKHWAVHRTECSLKAAAERQSRLEERLDRYDVVFLDDTVRRELIAVVADTL